MCDEVGCQMIGSVAVSGCIIKYIITEESTSMINVDLLQCPK